MCPQKILETSPRIRKLLCQAIAAAASATSGIHVKEASQIPVFSVAALTSNWVFCPPSRQTTVVPMAPRESFSLEAQPSCPQSVLAARVHGLACAGDHLSRTLMAPEDSNTSPRSTLWCPASILRWFQDDWHGLSQRPHGNYYSHGAAARVPRTLRVDHHYSWEYGACSHCSPIVSEGP